MQVRPYSVLARVYDDVMDYVDHEAWADYIDHLLDEHETEPANVVEFGCGTGQFARHFLARRNVKFTATDGSADMLSQATERLDGRAKTLEVTYPGPAVPGGPYDVAILLYDGLNYLTTEDGIRGLLAQVKASVAPGGLFVFDQSTPANSINNAEFFEDEDELDEGSYVRKSAYDEETRMHTTRFELTLDDGVFEEEHVERAWTKEEIEGLLTEAGWRVQAAYDGFSFDPAGDDAERIHWVATHD